MGGIFWLVWLILALIIFGIFGWSLSILFQQKKAWRAFSAKHKLQYVAGKMTQPPSMNGMYGGQRMFLFTDAQTTEDMRGQRFVTVIELELGEGLPLAAALGSGKMSRFILQLNFEQEFVPDSEYWKSDYILRTRYARRLHKYLTPERLRALSNLFTMSNSSVLFFFDDLAAVLRIETTDPLCDADKIEKILNRIISQVQMLKVGPAERKRLLAIREDSIDDIPEEESQSADADKGSDKETDGKST